MNEQTKRAYRAYREQGYTASVALACVRHEQRVRELDRECDWRDGSTGHGYYVEARLPRNGFTLILRYEDDTDGIVPDELTPEEENYYKTQVEWGVLIVRAEDERGRELAEEALGGVELNYPDARLQYELAALDVMLSAGMIEDVEEQAAKRVAQLSFLAHA